jgi:hypothetical protein
MLCEIEDQDDALSAFVEVLSDTFEPFLSRSVPDLQLDLCAVDIHFIDLVIDTKSRRNRLSEYSFSELIQNRTFPDLRVS